MQRPFQLTHCLYDAALLKLSETHTIWFFNQHHLITDASSFFLIAETVLSHYDAWRYGEELPLGQKPLFVQYAASLKRPPGSSRAAKSTGVLAGESDPKARAAAFYGPFPAKLSNHVQRWVHN